MDFYKVFAIIAVVALAPACSDTSPRFEPGKDVHGWPVYAGDPGGSKFSPLADIHEGNVDFLEPAWVYRHGDVAGNRLPAGIKTAFQATPILLDETLYFCTPLNRLIALDANDGSERWVYDAEPDLTGHNGTLKCRGVAVTRISGNGACAVTVYMGTLDARLVAVDGETGKPCETFGRSGAIDLLAGLGDVLPAETYPTSPPVIAGDVVVTGSYVADNVRLSPPGGVIRAYDTRTGELRWAFDPVAPDRAQANATTFTRGTANAWSLFSVDNELGLIFLPMGGPSPDFYGGQRDGLGYYGSSVVALDAATGDVRWHFQTVHHDLWDYDLAAQPLLIDAEVDGELRAAVVQGTKTGHIFVLDRITGEPLFPVEERPVAQSDVPGENSARTQPFPSKPKPLYGDGLRPESAWGLTPLDRGWCQKRLSELRNEGLFTPPSLAGSFQYPGVGGGINWGGIAYEPKQQLLIFADNSIGYSIRLIERDPQAPQTASPGAYDSAPMLGAPYSLEMEAVVSPLGIPCTPPPWGSLKAVSMETGDLVWQQPLGTLRDMAPLPIPLKIGMPTMGGPLVTAGGLVFVGATMDDYLRAFSVESGEELWRARLPAGPQASPMTYRTRPGARQFVVIAAGGHATMQTTPGDYLIAFALPTP